MPAPPLSPGSPDPIFPDYQGACLSTLVPALLSGSAGGNGNDARSPAWLPAPAREARQIVLLIVDGLGWQQLTSRPGLAPTLTGAAGIERSITSVTPTTTACALTSIATGRPPSDHGLLGYRLAAGDGEIMNALRWTVGIGRPRDARQELPAPTYQPYPPFPGAARPVPVVSRSEFGGTGFTAAHLGASTLAGYKVTSSLVVEVRRLLSAGEPFVYAYYDGIDKVAHEHGLGPYYDAELETVDRLVGDIASTLPPGAALVVSADHGQIDIGTNVELLGREVMGATRFLSGEGRFRWLHARPGAAGDLLATVDERYRDTTWVMTRDQLVDEGWFGGPLRDGVADRLGDVALIPHAPVAFLDPADAGESNLAARHGSLTADEMLVPLVAIAGGSI
ncbi:MAG TPA: alkaline phosphatase family protein [Acidimicrobiales bacterium]|nr:alkaline phosphatase family protein [Acidimicrobiales bacterium]